MQGPAPGAPWVTRGRSSRPRGTATPTRPGVAGARADANVTVMSSEGAFDCERCGACCRAQPPFGGGVYVRLDADDLARLRADDVARLVVGVVDPTHRGRALRLATTDRGEQVCAALEGRPGERVACSIYPRRPGACRRLEAGSDACLLARDEAGLGGRGS